jgi:hypothetical protein
MIENNKGVVACRLMGEHVLHVGGGGMVERPAGKVGPTTHSVGKIAARHRPEEGILFLSQVRREWD